MVSEDPTKKTRRGGVVSKRLCVITTVGLSITATILLILMIFTLNGSIAPLRDRNYNRPAPWINMDEYDVVQMSVVNCRKNVAMDFHKLSLSPSPLVVPDGAETSNLNIHYNFTLKADMPDNLVMDVLIQRLQPPWITVKCMDGSGSCRYPKPCQMIGKLFGKNNCTELKAGYYTGMKANQLIDLTGAFRWAKPGNYYAQIRLNILEQAFACVGLTFRIKSK